MFGENDLSESEIKKAREGLQRGNMTDRRMTETGEERGKERSNSRLFVICSVWYNQYIYILQLVISQTISRAAHE